MPSSQKVTRAMRVRVPGENEGWSGVLELLGAKAVKQPMRQPALPSLQAVDAVVHYLEDSHYCFIEVHNHVFFETISNGLVVESSFSDTTGQFGVVGGQVSISLTQLVEFVGSSANHIWVPKSSFEENEQSGDCGDYESRGSFISFGHNDMQGFSL